jgi:hypothetical protein
VCFGFVLINIFFQGISKTSSPVVTAANVVTPTKASSSSTTTTTSTTSTTSSQPTISTNNPTPPRMDKQDETRPFDMADAAAIASRLPPAPYYQLAHDLLREMRTPMHYRDIAAALRASGRDVSCLIRKCCKNTQSLISLCLQVHQDTIMGSLNGYINTVVGKKVLVRVGKGTYTLREYVQNGTVRVGPDGLVASLPRGPVVQKQQQQQQQQQQLKQQQQQQQHLLQQPQQQVEVVASFAPPLVTISQSLQDSLKLVARSPFALLHEYLTPCLSSGKHW